MAKVNKNGLADLKNLIPEEIEEVSFNDVDWGIKVTAKKAKLLEKACEMRKSAFDMIEYQRAEWPRRPGLIDDLKKLRAKEKTLNDKVGKLVHATWAKFYREEPVLAIVIKTDKEKEAAVKDRINTLINKSDTVAARNLIAEEIAALQAEVDVIDNMGNEIAATFAEAEDLLKKAGYDPAEIWPRKESKPEE